MECVNSGASVNAVGKVCLDVCLLVCDLFVCFLSVGSCESRQKGVEFLKGCKDVFMYVIYMCYFDSFCQQ